MKSRWSEHFSAIKGDILVFLKKKFLLLNKLSKNTEKYNKNCKKTSFKKSNWNERFSATKGDMFDFEKRSFCSKSKFKVVYIPRIFFALSTSSLLAVLTPSNGYSNPSCSHLNLPISW